MPSAQQMQMQVIDGLTAVRTGVDHHTVSTIQSCTARDFRSLRYQVAKQRGMPLLGMRLHCRCAR